MGTSVYDTQVRVGYDAVYILIINVYLIFIYKVLYRYVSFPSKTAIKQKVERN